MKPPMPEIIRGDARNLPLPDESVDLIVTSPPYFGLRAYTDGGEAYDGQIGAEATPAEFIDALLDCTREWMRALRPTGSIFVNLGDKYSGAAGPKTGRRTFTDGHRDGGRWPSTPRGRAATGAPPKSLLLLPERYRIACTDELGLIARAVLVWSKPNGLPESVTDRVRRSHEDWVHLTKAPQYFSAVDEIREPTSYVGPTWEQRKAKGQPMRHGDTGGGASKGAAGGMAANPLGKLPGSVWEIATQPLKVPAELGVDHFAAFPMEWPRLLILGWSPREVCTACGEGRRWFTGVSAEYVIASGTTGYDDCACLDTSAPTTPGVVLDPFGGTGTTALVAAMHGRQGISVDLSLDYCRLAEWRASDPKERARAAGLDPAAVRPQLAGQFDLFGEAS